MLRWLPRTLFRLYYLLAEAVPYARTTRALKAASVPAPPPTSGLERLNRLHIAYDAFCEHRPRPGALFRPALARRGLTSWCEEPDAIRRPRCAACAHAHRLHAAAGRGDEDAERTLYTLARRGARRLASERACHADAQSILREAARERRARFATERPNWPVLRALYGDRERRKPPNHIQERQQEERALMRAQASYVRALIKRRRAWLRDRSPHIAASPASPKLAAAARAALAKPARAARPRTVARRAAPPRASAPRPTGPAPADATVIPPHGASGALVLRPASAPLPPGTVSDLVAVALHAVRAVVPAVRPAVPETLAADAQPSSPAADATIAASSSATPAETAIAAGIAAGIAAADIAPLQHAPPDATPEMAPDGRPDVPPAALDDRCESADAPRRAAASRLASHGAR